MQKRVYATSAVGDIWCPSPDGLLKDNVDEMTRPLPNLDRSLEAMQEVLSRKRPELLANLNPPASDEQLAMLRSAVDPMPLSTAVETWYRFANGQRTFGWWPVINGPMVSIDRATSTYAVDIEFHPRQLFPLSAESHYSVSIDLLAGEHSPLVETTVSSSEWRIVAPSLATAFQVITELIDTDELGEWPISHPSVEHYQRTHALLAEQVSSRMSEFDATHLPFPVGEWFPREEGPWGPFPTLPW